MKNEGHSYGERFPHFANYIKNPEVEDDIVQPKNPLDILECIFKEEPGPCEEDFDNFCDSVVEWDEQFIVFEPYGHHYYDKKVGKSNRNTELIRLGIKWKLGELPDKKERINYLLSLRKEIQLGDFFPEIHTYSERISEFINAEITFWKDYVESTKEAVQIGESESDVAFIEGSVRAGISIAKRVMLLDDLGILHHLKSKFPKAHSIRKLSLILAPMLSVNHDTIRKVITAIRSSAPDKNNPYNSKENRIWLEAYYLELGLTENRISDKDLGESP